MDVLTDVLQTFHLQSTVLYRGRVNAPFGVVFFPRQREGADASFHIVTEGECLIQVEGKETLPVRLHTGDFVLLPQGDTHSLRDTYDTPVSPLELLKPQATTDETGTVRFGGNGPITGIVCGKFHFRDGATNPLIQSLPPLLIVRGEQGKVLPWLEATLGFLACETQNDRPGASTVIARLCDILFIQAVRAYVEEIPPCSRGFVRAMVDPQLGLALQAIHTNPARSWTVADLAREAAMSRSAFAARFCELMGEPPLHYLTRWRIHRASGLLQDGFSLIEVAERVGYGSEAAFSKVYKRWTGVAPGKVRKELRVVGANVSA